MADKYNSKIAKWIAPKGKDLWAITVSKNTTLYSSPKEKVDTQWRNHEEKHKEQYTKEGWFKFVAKYLYYQVRYGYKNNPYEVEARAAEIKL